MQTLQAEKRLHKQKSAMRDERFKGKVPAVVYGKNIESTPLYVEEAQLLKLIREYGSNVLLQLNWDSQTSSVMISDMQINPLKQSLIHIDFHEVNLKQKTRVEVPIVLIGEESVTKTGAVLQKQTHMLEVEALPTHIPDRINVDVTGLEIGDHLAVGDVVVPKDVQILADKETVILSVLPPALEANTEEESADQAEPQAGEGEKTAED